MIRLGFGAYLTKKPNKLCEKFVKVSGGRQFGPKMAHKLRQMDYY